MKLSYVDKVIATEDEDLDDGKSLVKKAEIFKRQEKIHDAMV